MYYPFYNNPFYYPNRAYMNNMCSLSNAYGNFSNEQNTNRTICNNRNSYEINLNDNYNTTNDTLKNNAFSITDDRVELFGISINIDDLIILITLFFMFKENQIDYSIVIILAIILFDQK